MKRAATVIATLCALWAVNPYGASSLAADEPPAPPAISPVVAKPALLPPPPPALDLGDRLKDLMAQPVPQMKAEKAFPAPKMKAVATPPVPKAKASKAAAARKAAAMAPPPPPPLNLPKTASGASAMLMPPLPAPLKLSPSSLAAPQDSATPMMKAEAPKNYVVQECRGTTEQARRVTDDLRVFRALFQPEHTAALIAAGCVRVQKGCNSCVVRYSECKAAARACTDGACLAKHCERKLRCTAKLCTAEGQETPSCESRLARHSCALSLFPGAKGSIMEGVPVVQRR